jgi:enoyl-CoA hydratase
VENEGPDGGSLIQATGRGGGEAAAADIMIGSDRAAAFVTLNRPQALNALTTSMRAAMARAYPVWARDPEIYAVVVSSASDRAFCAGGDLREITEWGKNR